MGRRWTTRAQWDPIRIASALILASSLTASSPSTAAPTVSFSETPTLQAAGTPTLAPTPRPSKKRFKKKQKAKKQKRAKTPKIKVKKTKRSKKTAAPRRLGALGDSLTDEYLGSPGTVGATDLPALNWVQILIQERGLDFGAFEAVAGVRGEPRNEGYAHNWARSGATALANPFGLSDVTLQANGLAPAVAAGQVDLVYLGIGSNDFFFRELFGLPMSGPSFDAFAQDLVDAIFGAVDTLQAAGPVDIVLNRLPAGTAGGQDPLTLAAIEAVNTLLLAEAALRGLPVIDVFTSLQEPGRRDAFDNLLVGGWVIPPNSVADLGQTVPIGSPGAGPCNSSGQCATATYAQNFTADDGIHPNTVVQGLLANAVLEALNGLFGLGIPLLSDAEILDAAAP